MNQLSWMLYWADVLPGLSNGVIWFCLLATACFGGLAYHSLFNGKEVTQVWNNGKYEEQYTNDAVRAQKYGWSLWALPATIAVTLLMNFIPSKDTFYLIAASEAGEQALTTPEAVKIRAVINKWLDDAVKEEPEKK